MEIKIQEQTPSMKLIKGQKDIYGWEIRLFGKDTEKVIEQLKKVDDKLKDQF